MKSRLSRTIRRPQQKPQDFVIATGRTTTVREVYWTAFEYLDLILDDYILIDPRYFRPAEVDVLLGDPQKAREKLGWEPEISLEEMIREMVDADLERVGQENPGKRGKIGKLKQ